MEGKGNKRVLNRNRTEHVPDRKRRLCPLSLSPSLCLWPSPMKPDTYESIVSRARTPSRASPHTSKIARDSIHLFLHAVAVRRPTCEERENGSFSSGWFLTEVCGSLGGARTTLNTKCLTPSSILGTTPPPPSTSWVASPCQGSTTLPRFTHVFNFTVRDSCPGRCRQRQPTCPAFFACNAHHMCVPRCRTSSRGRLHYLAMAPGSSSPPHKVPTISSWPSSSNPAERAVFDHHRLVGDR